MIEICRQQSTTMDPNTHTHTNRDEDREKAGSCIETPKYCVQIESVLALALLFFIFRQFVSSGQNPRFQS